MQGYMGKALIVELEHQKYEEWDIPEDWFRDFVGGEGLAVRAFMEYTDFNETPSEPRQPLIFATGPLTGTSFPTSGRGCFVFRSPTTGTLGISNVGGKLAPALKKAGYDLLIVRGASKSPVTLMVDDDRIDFIDAASLWGQTVSKTNSNLKDTLGSNFQIAAIGPAGENRVMFAAIMHDSERAAGRGGGGMVMGLKNLKAIAVNGTKHIPLGNKEELKAFSKKAREEFLGEAFVGGLLKNFGTPGFFDSINGLGLLPTKNWQNMTFPEANDEFGYAAYHEKLNVKPYACYGCPAGCGRVTRVESGPYKGSHGGGPEYETVAAFGAKCYIKDINTVAHCGHLCNDLGLDTISTGQVIASAMEWCEKGFLKSADLDGRSLDWGDAESTVTLIRKIAYREGVGNLLADGVKRVAEKLGNGAEIAAMHNKGLELAACGVRASKAEVISSVISPRGGDHLRPYASVIDAFGYRSEALGITGDIDIKEDGNKEWVKTLKQYAMVTNLMGTCMFTVITLGIQPGTYAESLSAVLGDDISVERLMESAERVINMERMLNAKWGFNKTTDTLPARLTDEPAADGPGKGSVVNMEPLLSSFYSAMGWKDDDGLPEEKTLVRLELDWI